MPLHNARSLFDYDAFMWDVRQYLRLQNISGRELAKTLDLGPDYASRVFMGLRRFTPSFSVVLKLAEIADLSLDNYRKGGELNCQMSNHAVTNGPFLKINSLVGYLALARTHIVCPGCQREVKLYYSEGSKQWMIRLHKIGE